MSSTIIRQQIGVHTCKKRVEDPFQCQSFQRCVPFDLAGTLSLLLSPILNHPSACNLKPDLFPPPRPLHLLPDGPTFLPSFLSHRSTEKWEPPSTCASAWHTWAWVSRISSSILVFMSSGLLRSSRRSVTGKAMKQLQRRTNSSSSSGLPGEGLRAPELLGTISARSTCRKAAAARPASAAASPVPSQGPPPALVRCPSPRLCSVPAVPGGRQMRPAAQRRDQARSSPQPPRAARQLGPALILPRCKAMFPRCHP